MLTGFEVSERIGSVAEGDRLEYVYPALRRFFGPARPITKSNRAGPFYRPIPVDSTGLASSEPPAAGLKLSPAAADSDYRKDIAASNAADSVRT